MSKVHLALSRYKTTPELRDSIERQAGELVSSELNRCDEEWHAAVASVKDTVAVLERTCDAFLSKTHMTPSGEIQHLVDRIVKTAAEEAERAAELVRAEAGQKLASAEELTDRLQAELNVARGELITTRQRFDAEHVARTRAEAEWHGAQAQYDQLAMERECQLQRQRADLEARRGECEALSQQLESARAEREALTAVLQTVRNTIQQAIVATDVPASSIQGHSATGDRQPDVVPHTPVVAAEPTPVSAGPLAAPVGGPRDAAALAIAPRASAQGAESDSTLAAHVERLLEAAERKHHDDLESGLRPFEAADRLTSNLRDARDQFVQNIGGVYTEPASVFETLLMRLIDKHGATTFGRHLGIAAYELDAAKAS
jgi:hypothetical protein